MQYSEQNARKAHNNFKKWPKIIFRNDQINTFPYLIGQCFIFYILQSIRTKNRDFFCHFTPQNRDFF